MLQYVDYTLKYKIPILHKPYRSQEKGMLWILKTSCNILTSKRHYYRQYVILKKNLIYTGYRVCWQYRLPTVAIRQNGEGVTLCRLFPHNSSVWKPHQPHSLNCSSKCQGRDAAQALWPWPKTTISTYQHRWINVDAHRVGFHTLSALVFALRLLWKRHTKLSK